MFSHKQLLAYYVYMYVYMYIGIYVRCRYGCKCGQNFKKKLERKPREDKRCKERIVWAEIHMKHERGKENEVVRRNS